MIRRLFLIFYLFILSIPLSAHLFQFKDRPGDQYFMRTFSVQEVLINNILKGTFDLKYKAHLEVHELGPSGAKISGEYFYYNKPYLSLRKYKLENRRHTKTWFYRQKNGRMKVPRQFFFPVVRHIPTFPKKDIKIGESWTDRGEEVQDLRKFGVSKPYFLPLKATYRYLRDEKFRGRECAVLEVFYMINQNNNKVIGRIASHFPARVIGFFKGIYYWDKKRGYPIYYDAEYDFIYILMNGQIREFKGIDYGDVKKTPPDPKITEAIPIPEERENEIKKEIEKKLKENNLPFPVRKKKKKITIDLGDLLFDFNLAKLKSTSTKQLDKLAKLLMKYDHFTIKVAGHTDSIGKTKMNKILSKNRAQKVRDYLVLKGVTADNIQFKGYGKSQPVASNETVEGRAKNRRVEIIISLDKESDKSD